MPTPVGVNIPWQSVTQKFTSCLATRLRKAVGFRNLAVHGYSSIDWAIVHANAIRLPGDFDAFAAWVGAQGR